MNVSSSSKSRKCRSGESSQCIVSQTNKSSSKKSTVEAIGIIKDKEEEWERELEDCQEAVVVHEVDKYLLDSIEKPPSPEKFNILEWWKMNGDKYPGLAALAKDVLAIQVRTVAAESSFSTGRRVIDPFRSSLSPKTVEALIATKIRLGLRVSITFNMFQLLRIWNFMNLWRKNMKRKVLMLWITRKCLLPPNLLKLPKGKL